MTSAVILVPDIEGKYLFAAQCLDYCAARGYDVAGMIVGDWSAVVDVVRARSIAVVVVARGEHLNPDREPRIEVATPGGGRDVATSQDRRRTGRRRPRRLT